MLISLNWLNEYIDIKDIEIEELENALTMIGQEVEKIEIKGKHLEKVLTAQVVEYQMHPDSDHLTLCKVDNGSEILQVVCGAPNHKLGDKVAMAQIGAELEPGFVIKKGKIRGQESCGMLCSSKELGLGNDAEGIIILPEDTELGISLDKYYGINDIVFELEITPNRPDCLSYIGIARELSAYYNKELKYPDIEIKNEIEEKTDTLVNVDIEDKTLSKRFVARIVKNVKVDESPKWLKDKIESMGMKSINNIVDISNYIMLEMNQPNHLYDLDILGGNADILVKRANDDEVFYTLDEEERILTNNDIVITNKGKTIGIAGVMGGLDSAIKDSTTNILIEVADFNKDMVRKTSRTLGIMSDASYRFERGIDEKNIINVANRLANTLVEVAGGEILYGIVDKYVDETTPNISNINLSRLNKFIGKNVPKERIVEILLSLNILVLDKGEELEVTPPSYRQDLLSEQDYYEEIIRMYGFDNIENILPKLDVNINNVVDTTKYIYKVKEIVSSLGLNEVINYSFIPKDGLEKIKYNIMETIDVINPITEDFTTMRPTLMYNLIKNVRDNYNRSVSDMKFFEVSRTFIENNEVLKLGIILAGSKNKSLWIDKVEEYDFYDIKGIIENVLSNIGLKRYQVRRSTNKAYHPGRSADIFVGKNYIGTLGELHPDVQENMDITKIKIIYSELNLDEIKKYVNNNIRYTSISKYQSVSRDIAVLVDENVLVGDMLSSISNIDKLVEKIELFDIYKGKNIDDNKKSVAINILLRDNNKTLVENDINNVVNKIINKLEKEYKAELRQ